MHFGFARHNLVVCLPRYKTRKGLSPNRPSVRKDACPHRVRHCLARCSRRRRLPDAGVYRLVRPSHGLGEQLRHQQRHAPSHRDSPRLRDIQHPAALLQAHGPHLLARRHAPGGRPRPNVQHRLLGHRLQAEHLQLHPLCRGQRVCDPQSGASRCVVACMSLVPSDCPQVTATARTRTP